MDSPENIRTLVDEISHKLATPYYDLLDKFEENLYAFRHLFAANYGKLIEKFLQQHPQDPSLDQYFKTNPVNILFVPYPALEQLDKKSEVIRNYFLFRKKIAKEMVKNKQLKAFMKDLLHQYGSAILQYREALEYFTKTQFENNILNKIFRCYLVNLLEIIHTMKQDLLKIFWEVGRSPDLWRTSDPEKISKLLSHFSVALYELPNFLQSDGYSNTSQNFSKMLESLGDAGCLLGTTQDPELEAILHLYLSEFASTIAYYYDDVYDIFLLSLNDSIQDFLSRTRKRIQEIQEAPFEERSYAEVSELISNYLVLGKNLCQNHKSSVGWAFLSLYLALKESSRNPYPDPPRDEYLLREAYNRYLKNSKEFEKVQQKFYSRDKYKWYNTY